MKAFQKYLNDCLNEDNDTDIVNNLAKEKRLSMFKTSKKSDGNIQYGIDKVAPDVEVDQFGNISREDPIWDDPKITWFIQSQSGRVKKAQPKEGPSWGEGTIAVFPDGHWAYYKDDWDTSG